MKRLGLPPRRLASEDSETLQTSVPKTPIRGYVVGTTQNRALPPIMWTKASFTLASGNLSIMAQTPERSACRALGARFAAGLEDHGDAHFAPEGRSRLYLTVGIGRVGCELTFGSLRRWTYDGAPGLKGIRSENESGLLRAVYAEMTDAELQEVADDANSLTEVERATLRCAARSRDREGFWLMTP